MISPAILFFLGAAAAFDGHPVYSNSFAGVAGGDPALCAEVSPALSSYNLWTQTDGDGHLVPANTHGSTRLNVQLSEGPVFADSGVRALNLTVVLKAPRTNWVGVGFQESTVGPLNSDENTGPWLLVRSSSISVHGGTGVTGSTDQFLNTHAAGDVLTIEMTCYTNQTVDIRVNGALVANGLAIEHVDSAGTSVSPTYQCISLQFFSQPTDGSVYIDRLDISERMKPGVFFLREDFGAACDGITDDAPALKNALDAAAAYAGPELFELRLPANAVIKLNTAYSSSQLFSAEGIDRFYLNGNNSTFLVGTGTEGSLTGKGLFLLSDVTDSTFRNFTVDYEEAPWSQGDLVEIDTDSRKIVVRNDDGYMAADDPRLSNTDSTWITLHDEAGLLAYSGVLYVTGTTELDDGTVELSYTKWPAAIDPEACSRYVRVWRSGGAHVFNFRSPENLTLDGICLYASPTMGFVFNNARPGVEVLNCRIEPKPGSGRMISSTADGIHFLGASTEGPRIENNTLVKLEDDAIVVHCQGAYIYEASGSTVYLQRAHRRIVWETGDRLGLYNFNKNECFTNGVITSLTAGVYPPDDPVYPNELYWQVVLDEPVPAGFEIEPVSSYYDAGRTLTVGYDLNKCNDGTVIRNNVVEYNRARGILANGSGFLIEGNTIAHTTMPGMMLGSIQRYGNPNEILTFPIRNTAIVSNVLVSTQNYGGYQPSLGRSSIFCSNWDKLVNDYAQESFFNQNITVSGNQISHCGYSAVRFNSASNCTTSGNVFDSLNRQVASGETYAIEYENGIGMDAVNMNNVITNCTVTTEVKVWP